MLLVSFIPITTLPIRTRMRSSGQRGLKRPPSFSTNRGISMFMARRLAPLARVVAGHHTVRHHVAHQHCSLTVVVMLRKAPQMAGPAWPRLRSAAACSHASRAAAIWSTAGRAAARLVAPLLGAKWGAIVAQQRATGNQLGRFFQGAELVLSDI